MAKKDTTTPMEAKVPALSLIDAKEELCFKLDRVIAICDLASEHKLAAVNLDNIGTLFYMCLDLASSCKDHLNKITSVEEAVA